VCRQQQLGIDNVLANLLLTHAAATLRQSTSTSAPQQKQVSSHQQTQTQLPQSSIASLASALGMNSVVAAGASKAAAKAAVSVPAAPVPPPAAAAAAAAPPATSVDKFADNHTRQLKAAFEEHLRSQNITLPSAVPSGTGGVAASPVDDRKPAAVAAAKGPNHDGNRRPGQINEDEKDAGNILMGFLSSLRSSYEDALRNKNTTSGSKPMGSTKLSPQPQPQVTFVKSSSTSRTKRPSAVTDSSSQPAESSVEDSDWNSDNGGKKTSSDPASSSEDSDGSGNARKVQQVGDKYSKGPPRKRYKSMAAVRSEGRQTI